MGPVRTFGSASASRLETNLPYRANGNESVDASDDAHKPVTAISRTFIVMCDDTVMKRNSSRTVDSYTTRLGYLEPERVLCNDVWLPRTRKMYRLTYCSGRADTIQGPYMAKATATPWRRSICYGVQKSDQKNTRVTRCTASHAIIVLCRSESSS